MVHVQILNLVFLGPGFANEGMQSGIGVGAVLGDDDRLAFTCTTLKLLLPGDFGRRKITGEAIPAVLAVQHQNVAELGDPAFPVRCQHHADEANGPCRIRLTGHLDSG
jgi:hypothetical protein